MSILKSFDNITLHYRRIMEFVVGVLEYSMNLHYFRINVDYDNVV